jgi:transcriptional regulator with XRE-family HTH domain
MAVATQDKVRALGEDFSSLREVADVLGVDVAQISRWRRGGGIDEANALRVDLLEFVMAQLTRIYDRQTARDWLFGLNPNLGDRRPIDLIRAGRTEELIRLTSACSTAASAGCRRRIRKSLAVRSTSRATTKARGATTTRISTARST